MNDPANDPSMASESWRPVASEPGTSQPSRWPWVVTGFTIAFAAGLIANPWFETQVRARLPEALRGQSSSVSDQATLSTVSALEQRVARLEAKTAAAPNSSDLNARLAVLETKLGAPVTPNTGGSATTPSVTPVSLSNPLYEQRLAAAEAKLAALEQSSAGAAVQIQTVQAMVTAMEGRLAQANAQNEGLLASVKADAERARKLASLAAARRAFEAGRPLGPVSAALSDLFGARNADVMALRRIENGGLTLTILRRQYRALERQVAQTNTGSWFDQAVTSVKGLVQVRRAGQAIQPASPDDALIAADQRLAASDVAGAMAIIRKLPQPMQVKAQPWLANAQAYQGARDALARLEAIALAG